MTAVGDVDAAVADRYPTRLAEGEPTPFPRVDPVVWGIAPGPVTDGDVEGYDRDGFLAIDQLVPPAEAAELLAEAHRLAGDPRGRDDERWVREPGSDEVRSVFEVHRISERFAALVADVRLAGIARQLLGSDVGIHQSRINLKPGFGGKEFDWHSDFETWHAEDGLPAMRTVSISLALTPNLESNGPLMIIPGSHRTFIPCVGETPDAHYRESLRRQEVGVPDHAVIAELAEQSGIRVLTGASGSATVFDSNCLHGSNSNISPYPRSTVFIVYNSTENPLAAPFAASRPRPTFIADRDPVVV
jgi:ectoine hydroxylase